MLKRNLIVVLILLLATADPAGAIKYKGDLESNESITFPEQSAKPASPASGKHKLYFKDDGAAYSLDSSGNENPVDVAGLKNYLINGNFRLWQRGTSFNVTQVYGPDRWKVGSGGTFTATRQAFTLGQTDVPGEPEFYIRNDTTVAGAATATLLRQRIEGVRTLAGQTATWSFWAKAGATKTFQVLILQNFGTGGTPSTTVTVLNSSQAITTLWVRYTFTVAMPSITGKTLGTNADDYIEVLIQETSGFSTYILDIASVQVEKGSVATAFERRPIGLNLALAQRYFWKTYEPSDAPATATTNGAQEIRLGGLNSASHLVRKAFRFWVPMRTVPTITLYTDGGVSGNWRDLVAAADVSASAVRISETTVSVESTGAVATSVFLLGHIVADAEL